jgi:hypothetical protein
MPRSPEQPPRKETQPAPLLFASRFESREASQAPYDSIQNWPESMSKAPPSEKLWYVAVLGNTPPEPLAQQVREAINTGEVVPLPDEVIAEMARRRRIETAEHPFSEIHRSFTASSKKEKQTCSRRSPS